MRKFIVLISIFLTLLLLVMAGTFWLKPKGQIGGYYERFASPKAYSLILGSSMAAQDIDPMVIDSVFNNVYKLPIYNYSFSIHVSPYGVVYSNSILRKLADNQNRNSLFILAVDPFSIGNSLTDVEGGKRREEGGYLDNMWCVHHVPNVEYLLFYSVLDKQFYKKTTSTGFINESGRYVSGRQMNEDSSEVLKRIHEVILPDYYDNILPNYSPSNERVESLMKLVRQLRERGDVFLVRLPVGPEISMITDSIYPNFDQDMKEWASQEGVGYINFKADSARYRTTDGVHLYASEGSRLTLALCDSIKKIKRN